MWGEGGRDGERYTCAVHHSQTIQIGRVSCVLLQRHSCIRASEYSASARRQCPRFPQSVPPRRARARPYVNCSFVAARFVVINLPRSSLRRNRWTNFAVYMPITRYRIFSYLVSLQNCLNFEACRGRSNFHPGRDRNHDHIYDPDANRDSDFNLS
ncbi:hypothetical protein EVAR_43121_1 [Eumeta japonica]|uniref:Uncharacterized protein n=1 Tax=Eumeta variegata TaxID=151549 RepID=A0A4C1XR03_EUMVA|nr:hypothetical protein EVAR_43121_1 [Eumeta japonica]